MTLFWTALCLAMIAGGYWAYRESAKDLDKDQDWEDISWP